MPSRSNKVQSPKSFSVCGGVDFDLPFPYPAFVRIARMSGSASCPVTARPAKLDPPLDRVRLLLTIPVPLSSFALCVRARACQCPHR